MTRGAALGEALLVTLGTPPTWLLALAVFLLRGGLLLVLLPIVAVPSPVGLGNLLAPLLMTVVFQGISVEVAALLGVALLVTLAWIVVGGLAACTLEADGIRIVAAETGPHPRPGTGAAGLDSEGPEDAADAAETEAAGTSLEARQYLVAARMLVARIVAHVPTGVVAIVGAARFVTVAYGELTSPLDVTTPIVVRVLLGAPEAVAAVGLVWAAGEIVGGLAARRVVLDGAPAGEALRDALQTVVRRPLAVVARFVVPLLALVAVLLPSIFAAAGAWTLVRASMGPADGAVAATAAVLLFVTLWLVGLLLIAVTAAWRSAVWTVGHGDRSPVRTPRQAVPPG